MLRGNKVLTSLKLQKCDIGPEGLSELCSALEMNTTLTELDLSLNMFHDHKYSLASLGKLLIITVAVMTVSEAVIDAQLKQFTLLSVIAILCGSRLVLRKWHLCSVVVSSCVVMLLPHPFGFF